MPFFPFTGSESMGRPRPSSATLTEPSACKVIVTVDPPWLGSATSSTALSTSSRSAVFEHVQTEVHRRPQACVLDIIELGDVGGGVTHCSSLPSVMGAPQES